jgi:predicted  nucleic acid-binding Zn-ribbon protein
MPSFGRFWSAGVCLCAVVSTASFPVAGAEKLADAGEKLQARYAEDLNQLRAEIAKSLPAIDASKRAALERARDASQAATAELAKAQQNLDKLGQAQGLVEHAKGKWIGGAEKEIAKAQAALKTAKSDSERAAAMAAIAKWQANKEEGLKALEQRQAALDKVKADEPQWRQAHRAVQETLAKCRDAEAAALRAIFDDLGSTLTSDKLDTTIMRAVVLSSATPAGLAQFARQGQIEQAQVDGLLSNPALMKEMLVAGGPAQGKYGRALQIQSDIRKASQRSESGHFHRLAVAISLAHAEPIAQRNNESDKSAAAFVDPVQRYLHYEKAFLAGELDPAFPNLTTWEYRYVVDSYASDAMLSWGREMLRNYRPDHILNPDYGWRYSGAVRTDVAYRHSHEYTDSDDLSFFQNVCKNGGICGRRAFFGRYIVQAFGLPARPFTQPKHAALARWTPQGWVVNLGASWPVGWFPEQRGPEFLAETQARKFPQEYLRVLRADWIDAVVEPAAPNKKKPAPPGIWKLIARYEQNAIVADAKTTPSAALGADLAEATESKETRAASVAAAVVTDADKKIATNPNGEIYIPAAALGGGNHLVKSFLGGQQAIAAKAITAMIEVPKAGKYQLVANVVTVHGEEKMAVTVNGAKATADLSIPFTVGQWRLTPALEVPLVAGKNTLTLDPPAHSFALKGFTLIPVR